MNDNVIRPITGIYIFRSDGNLAAAPDRDWRPMVYPSGRIVKAIANVKTAPGTQPITLQVQYKRGAAAWAPCVVAANFQIAVGATVGSTTVITVPEMVEDDLLCLDIIQVGIGPAGADLTAQVMTVAP